MKIPATLLLSFIITTFSAQTHIRSILDSVFYKTKEISLYSSLVNWDSLQKQVYLKAENATTIEELGPAFETLLNGIRDPHGSILNAQTYNRIANFTDYENTDSPDKRVRELATWQAVNDTALKFEYKLLDKKVGYLKIVGIGPNADVEKEALKIREAINQLAKRKIDKWIIDLRYNGGGNMNPMMAGLAPLIGDGIVGKLVNLRGDTLFKWEIKDGNFTYGGYEARLTLPNTIRFKRTPTIAVLTSRFTVSSGELVATSLKGHPETKFFGEATGSFTTNNCWEIINNEVILNISTAVYCDRNGNVYRYNIPVDVEIPFVVEGEVEKDECIQVAVRWLVGK
jgi:carboxyl-terminal processing protease